MTDYVVLRTLGSALFRSGKSAQAVKVLRKAVESRKEPSPAAWIYLAMAHHQLGNKDDARQWLGKAKTWFDEMSKEEAAENKPGGSSRNRIPWNERLVLELTLREAEDLLQGTGK